MSKQVIWECDLCGCKKADVEYGESKRWNTIKMVVKSDVFEEEYSYDEMLLCPDCSVKFEEEYEELPIFEFFKIRFRNTLKMVIDGTTGLKKEDLDG